MFITRKRMQEKIAEALEKERQRQWQMDRIDNVERELYKRLDNMDMRLYRLERLVDGKVCSEKSDAPIR